MEKLKAIPLWLLILVTFYLAIVMSVALFDGRAIDFFGLKIDGKAKDCGPVQTDPEFVDITKRIEACEHELETALQIPSIDFIKGGEGGCRAACSSGGLDPVKIHTHPNGRPEYLCIAEAVYGRRGGFNYNYDGYEGMCIYHEFDKFGAMPYECVCK